MAAYYNEIDPFAAEWLKELIKAGHIAPGEVDTRSIKDVKANDLRGFSQAHFFAGIGGWSYALLRAGWSADRLVWTGSCPCQSFSAAGKGLGKADPRHLWPDFYRLIAECRPATVFGEQVEAAIRHGWLDDVQTDLENSGYAFGAVVFPACGIGAPHIRSRLYWVADASSEGLAGREEQSDGQERAAIERGCGDVIGQADNSGDRLERGRSEDDRGCDKRTVARGDGFDDCGTPESATSPTNGFWRDADWLLCRDGKWRPVEPGTFPLAHGVSARVGRLRGFGNAIVAQQAAEFIKAVM